MLQAIVALHMCRECLTSFTQYLLTNTPIIRMNPHFIITVMTLRIKYLLFLLAIIAQHPPVISWTTIIELIPILANFNIFRTSSTASIKPFRRMPLSNPPQSSKIIPYPRRLLVDMF